jgi:diguanylate cyclase (GGDEF)-like protein
MTAPASVLSESRINAGKVFGRLMTMVAWAGAATHAVFLVVFAWFGWPTLVVANVVSVTLFVGIGIALRRTRHTRLLANLAMVEVIAHAVLATLCLGWDSGFHFYLMAAVAVFAVGNNLKAMARWCTLILVAGTYVGLRAATHLLAPWYEVSEPLLRTLEYSNIVAMVMLMAVGASVHLSAVIQGERRLMHLVDTDPLTGLANRRLWLDAAGKASHALRRNGVPFSVLIVDVDHFKAVNDRHGHAGGDEALRIIGRTLQRGLRGIDSISRWGGEEFAIVLAGARREDAMRVAESLRRQVAALELQLPGGLVRLSVTVGAAQAVAGEDVLDVVQRADVALYHGKAAGRNRVETSPAPLAEAHWPA